MPPKVRAITEAKAKLLRAFAETFKRNLEVIQDRDRRAEEAGGSPRRPDPREAWLEGVHDTQVLNFLFHTDASGDIADGVALSAFFGRHAGVSMGGAGRPKPSSPRDRTSMRRRHWRNQIRPPGLLTRKSR
jgi:hypothetical protein